MKCNLRIVPQEDGKGKHFHWQLTAWVAPWTLTCHTPGFRMHEGQAGSCMGPPLHLHAAGQGHCTADHCSEQLEQDGAERVPRGRGESPEQPTWVPSLGLPALHPPGFCSATAGPFGNVVFDWPRACPSSAKWNGVLGLPSLQPSAQED